MSTARTLYLDLLKRSVLNLTYVDLDVRIQYLRDCLEGKARYDEKRLHDPYFGLRPTLEELTGAYKVGWPPGDDLRRIGYPHSMVGMRRLENLEQCFERVLADGIAGDLIECGVWRGGCAVFMRGLLAAYSVEDRVVWAADSFEGLPRPTHESDANFDLSKEKFPMLAVDLGAVQRVFAAYGLLDERVRFLKGWFKDSLPVAPIERLSILRLDGDLYESTTDALASLYDKVEPGGFVIVDDYIVPPCRQAITDFRHRRGIEDPIERIDHTGVFWRKS